MVQDRAMNTMADQQKVVYDLSNGVIFNDLERPLPRFQGHAIFDAEYLRNTQALLNSVVSNDLE